MDVKLVVEKGPARTRTIHLRGVKTIVGRQRGCDLRIPSNEVSRRHCLLSTQAGYLTVQDLASANGTYLNGKRIQSREAARPGDRIEIGPLTFVVEYQLTQEAINRMLAGPPEPEDLELLVVDYETNTPEEDLPLAVSEEDETAGFELVESNEEVIRPVKENVEEDDAPLKLDDAETWQLPEGDKLRDILSELEDPGRSQDSSKR